MGEKLYELTDDGRRMVLLLDLDHHVAPEFEKACALLRQSNEPKVVIDLTGVKFICSSCLGELILTNDRITEEKRSLLLRIPERLVSIFDLMSMRDIINTEVVK